MLNGGQHVTTTDIYKFRPQRRAFGLGSTTGWYDEYKKNRDHILSIVDKIPEIVSHPCGSYSKGTLDILNCLGAKVGFRSNFQKLSHGFLEFPRVDHSFILAESNQN